MTEKHNTGSIVLPVLFQPRGILAALVVGQCLAILLAFSPGTDHQVWFRLGAISLFVQCVVFLSLTGLYASRRGLARLPMLGQLIAGYTTVMLVTACLSIFSYVYLWLEPADELGRFLVSNLIIAFIITSLYLQFVTLHREATYSVAAVANAELDALQARIRPHFLYNSLNTAAELTHQDPQAAEQAILALAALSRAAMQAGKKSTLEEELELARRYLSLEKWRFGTRLQVEWVLPESLPPLSIPCLTLQPLFENAIIHGIEGLKEGGVIRVSIHVTARSVTLIITNPEASADVGRKGNGMATENIIRRLSLFYQGRAKMTRHREEGNYKVKLVLPREQMQ